MAPANIPLGWFARMFILCLGFSVSAASAVGHLRWLLRCHRSRLENGEVVSVRCDRGGETDAYYPSVRFLGPHGEPIEFESRMATRKHRVGNHVFVMIDGGPPEVYDPGLGTIKYFFLFIVGLFIILLSRSDHIDME